MYRNLNIYISPQYHDVWSIQKLFPHYRGRFNSGNTYMEKKLENAKINLFETFQAFFFP